MCLTKQSPARDLAFKNTEDTETGTRQIFSSATAFKEEKYAIHWHLILVSLVWTFSVVSLS